MPGPLCSRSFTFREVFWALFLTAFAASHSLFASSYSLFPTHSFFFSVTRCSAVTRCSIVDHSSLMMRSSLCFVSLFTGVALAVVSPDMSCGGTNQYTCPVCWITKFDRNDVNCWQSTAACCSQWGWCGSTSDFCGTGCLASYGTCTDPTPHPAPSGTTVSMNGKCGVITGVTYVCPVS